MKYDVSGKTFTDIMNISIKELQSMSRSDVAKVTSRLVSVANKRIRRMVKSGFKIKNIRFSINALEKSDIIQEFKELKSFLNDKRYSIKGQKEIIKKINQKLEEKGFEKIKNSAMFWDIYERLVDESELYEKFKYEVWQIIQEYLETNDEIVFSEIRKIAKKQIYKNARVSKKSRKNRSSKK